MNLPKSIDKLAEVDTDLGKAVVLNVDDLRVLAFPYEVDCFNAESIDTTHRTPIWPSGESLHRLNDFPEGPQLYGFDILGAFYGAIGQDPWTDSTPTELGVLMSLNILMISDTCRPKLKDNKNEATRSYRLARVSKNVKRIFLRCLEQRRNARINRIRLKRRSIIDRI
jgi:hypothetical protein